MSGSFSNTIPKNGKLNSLRRWYKPWFFKHVESFLERKKDETTTKSRVVVEYIPIRDYYHRHSRSIFWEIQVVSLFTKIKVLRFLN